MNGKIGVCLLGTLLLTTAPSAEAQQPKKIPSDRIPSWFAPFRSLGPHRGIPAEPARAWVRGGEKYCH